MEDYLKQIEQALQHNLYYIALQATLTLPDICGALKSKNGNATKNKYISWYNQYFKGTTWLSAEDCYFFRCSTVHQAKTIHEDSSYSRIVFVEPQTTPVVLHNCIFDDVLCIDLNTFCTEMISSVRNWLISMKNDKNFNNNYKTFFKRYPKGFSPCISGVPVIC